MSEIPIGFKQGESRGLAAEAARLMASDQIANAGALNCPT
jgi:hypothetical protein